MICTAKYHCDLIDENFGIAWRFEALNHGTEIPTEKINTAVIKQNNDSINSEQKERDVRSMSEV